MREWVAEENRHLCNNFNINMTFSKDRYGENIQTSIQIHPSIPRLEMKKYWFRLGLQGAGAQSFEPRFLFGCGLGVWGSKFGVQVWPVLVEVP